MRMAVRTHAYTTVFTTHRNSIFLPPSSPSPLTAVCKGWQGSFSVGQWDPRPLAGKPGRFAKTPQRTSLARARKSLMYGEGLHHVPGGDRALLGQMARFFSCQPLIA